MFLMPTIQAHHFQKVRNYFKIPYSVFNELSVDGVGNSLDVLRDYVNLT